MTRHSLLALEVARAQRLADRLRDYGHVLTPAERTIANAELEVALKSIKALALPMTRAVGEVRT